MSTIVLVGPEGQVVCDTASSPTAFSAVGADCSGARSCTAVTGMLIRPTWSVHTAFMRFAIDVVFLDADLTVVKIANSLRPWRTAFRRRAHQALELPAGECERLGIGVGDRLAWGSLEPDA